ncbi:ROK family protein, partial [Curtobacterium sp. CT11-45]
MSTTQSTPLALAVDLGGTKVEAALVTDAGVVLPATRFRSPTGPGRTSDELQAAVDEVVTAALDALPTDASLVGVGIGSAGPVDEEHGLVSPLNMPVWRGYPLRDRVAAHVPAGVPVTLRMDGLAITLAEHWVGAAQGSDHVMGMIVSTGVGGGLILHGRTVSGPTGNAGHIGHVECGGFDDHCACGGTGCLEAIASGPKTVAWAQRQGFTGSTGEELSA